MWLWSRAVVAVAVWFSPLAASAEAPPVAPSPSGELVTDASADVELGEYVRLSEEIERLALKNAWPGVERTFVQLLETGVHPGFDDWLRGAQAARTRGDLAAVRERLAAANALREDPAVLDWLWDIDSRYGPVSLRCDPGSFLTLDVDATPMDPDLQRAIAFGRAAIHRDCAFDGLLPIGEYRLYDRVVAVTPRAVAAVDLRGLEIDARRRRSLRRAWAAEDAGG
ncbi:MAG: hypothetical protein ABMB14_36405 [Myxococcota bacterium]